MPGIMGTCQQARRDGTSGYGSTLAVSTGEAVQSYPRSSIPCIAGIKTRGYDMHTSTMSMAPLFLPRKAMKLIPSRIAGASDSRMGWTQQEMVMSIFSTGISNALVT